MTKDDVMKHIRDFTPLAQTMAVLSGVVGQIEQDGMQRRPSGPVEVKGMMLDGVERILAKAVEVGLVMRMVDSEPSESDQGLIPIPDGYAEQ